MTYRFPILDNPAACAFLGGLRSGQFFTTYQAIAVIRGLLVVDVGIPVGASLNASIGRGIKAAAEGLGLFEARKKERIVVNGRKTCCSVWQMT